MEGDSVIFCPKILFHSFLANKSARLFTPAAVLKLEILFQISSDKKALFLAWKARANYLAPSSSSTSSGHATQCPTFLSPSTWSQVMVCRQPLAFILTWIRYRSWSVSNLTFVHISLLTVSLGDLLVQIQRVGDINPTFPLSGAYHVTPFITITVKSTLTQSGNTC